MKFKNYIKERVLVWLVDVLTDYFNYFTPRPYYHKLKKNPRIEEVSFKSIRGIKEKKYLTEPMTGWEGLETSLKLDGYDPEKFNYIELNQQYFIIEGRHRLCLLDVIHRNPLHKIKVKVYDLDMLGVNIMVTRRRMLFNFICISVITTLILLLV
jgi:hypothetical protein